MRQEEVSFAKKRSTFVKLTTVIIAVVVAVSVGIAAYFSMPKAAVADNRTNNNSVQQAADTELGAPAHRKYIKDNDDGTYRLSLDVTGNEASSEDSTTITKNKPLDIVLVLDVSGSMNYDISTGKQCGRRGTCNKKIDSLKTAVDLFLTKIDDKNSESGEQEKNQVALVKFSGKETDAEGDDEYTEDRQQWNYSQIVQPLTPSVASVRTKVQNLSPDGATRSDYGLNRAEEALKAARPEAQKVVVFFTDGEPTSTNTFDANVAGAAINTAQTMKADGTEVYSIGIFNSDENDDIDLYMNAVSSACPAASASPQTNRYGQTTMVVSSCDDPQPGYYLTADDADQLNNIFESISNTITTQSTTTYQGVSIQDTLSEYAQMASTPNEKLTATDANGQQVSLQPNQYEISVDSQTGTATLAFDEGYKLEKGVTYTLSFNVEPTDLAYKQFAQDAGKYLVNGQPIVGDENTDAVSNTSSSGKPGFYTNKEARVCYSVVSTTTTTGEEGTSDTAPGCADYKKPVLQVNEGKITLHKVWKDAAGNEITTPPQDSVTVTLSGTPASGNAQSEFTDQKVTLSGSNNWIATVDYLLPDYEYSVAEKDAPAGYEATYSYTLAAGTTSGTSDQNIDLTTAALRKAYNTPVELSATVTNQLQVTPVNFTGLQVTKRVNGHDLAAGQFRFSVTPEDPDSAAKLDVSASEGTVQADSPLSFTNAAAAPEGTSSVARAEAFKQFTYEDATSGKSFTYMYEEDQNQSTPGYALDSAVYKVVVTPKLSSDSTAIEVKTAIYKSDDGGTNYSSTPESTTLWTGTGDSKATVPFINRYVAVAILPSTGGRAASAWLSTIGGLGILLIVTTIGLARARKHSM